MLAVDSGGNITGYFRQQQGEGVVKTCAFFLAGKGASGEIPIVTWNAQAFQGTIKPERQGITVKVERGREHPGCGLVLSPEIARGLELDRITEAKWIDLRQIAQERVRFHSAPDAAHVLRSFVVSGDVVGVISERGDWIEVEYRGDKRTSGGWILTRTTRKLLPPERPNANRR